MILFPDIQKKFVYKNKTALFYIFQVVDVHINNKRVSPSQKGVKGVPNFAFVVFEDEKSAADCLSQKSINLPDGMGFTRCLNIEPKKNLDSKEKDGSKPKESEDTNNRENKNDKSRKRKAIEAPSASPPANKIQMKISKTGDR